MELRNLGGRRRFARMVSICALFLLSAAFAAMPVAADKHGSNSGQGSGDKVEMNDNHGANRGPGNVHDANLGVAKVDDDVDDANEHQGVVDNDANDDDDAVVKNEPNDVDDDVATPIMMPAAPTG